ncbi:MAG: AbrB/MazE/SpoVT family DNA-binding domain-containing protein [Thermoguttaceae bacterium]|jgi:antitoxin MazE
MIAKVQKWGNSLGVRIPKVLARDIQVEEGGEVDLRAEAGRLVIEPVRDKPLSLGELLSRITPENLHGEISFGRPVGREVW